MRQVGATIFMTCSRAWSAIPQRDLNIDHIDEAAWRGLTEKMLYVRGDLAMLELYEKLRDAINEVGIADGVPGNVIFYLAIADRFFGVVADQLGNAKLERDTGQIKA